MKHHNSERNGETHSIPSIGSSIGSSISPDYALTSEQAELTTVCFFNSQDYECVWVPQQLDYSKVTLNNELNAMVQKFAEHFHNSWAARKLDKGWTHGLLYSRRTTNHPRLVPFHRLQDYEKEFYKERCAECIRALVVWGYQLEIVDHDANERANQSKVLSGRNEHDSNPRPVDLSNMNLDKEILRVAEQLAENSHNLWARKVFDDLADNSAQYSSMPLALVPWELLTDFERRKNRFRTQEVLKFFQFYGYRIFSSSDSVDQMSIVDRFKIDGGATASCTTLGADRSSVEKRFAFNLLLTLVDFKILLMLVD